MFILELTVADRTKPADLDRASEWLGTHRLGFLMETKKNMFGYLVALALGVSGL